MKQADVIISGGGMVGLTLALALAQGGLKIAVVDAVAPEKTIAAEFDGRVSALAYAAVRMLKALGVWPHLEAHAQPIREILVSDGAIGRTASPFSLHFDAEEVGADSLGPYRGEPAHPRRALCGRRGRTEHHIDRARNGFGIDRRSRLASSRNFRTARNCRPRWRSPPMAANPGCAAKWASA